MNDDSIDYSNDSDGSIGNSDNSDDNAMADQDVQQGGDSLPLEDDEEDWGKFIELSLILNGISISNYNLEHYFAQVWSDQPGLELYTGNFLPDQVVDLDHTRSK